MAKKKPSEIRDDSAEPFEASLARLEEIVGDLEGGELGLSEALERYEEGVRRLKLCHGQLEAAERRIELLSGFDAAGNPVTTPYDHTATADDAASTARSARRTAPPREGKGRGGVDDASRLF